MSDSTSCHRVPKESSLRATITISLQGTSKLPFLFQTKHHINFFKTIRKMHTRNLNTLHSLFHSFSNSRNNTTRNQRNRRSQLLNHKERNRKIKVPKPLQIVFKSSSRVATRQRCHLDTREEPELRKENCAATRSSTHRNTI